MAQRPIQMHFHPNWRFGVCRPAHYSLSNPSVHSLLVTLGNHWIRDSPTYNWPCPAGPSADLLDVPPDSTPAHYDRICSVLRQDQVLEFALLWHCLASTSKRFLPVLRSTFSRASCRMPYPNTRRSSRMMPRT